MCTHANFSGLMGKTILEEGQIDMIIESLNDLAVPVMTLIFESDEKKQVRDFLIWIYS